jgi:hypothetical protein
LNQEKEEVEKQGINNSNNLLRNQDVFNAEIIDFIALISLLVVSE